MEKKLHYYYFFVNSELHDKWYRTIPRQNWKVSKSHKVFESIFMKVISKLLQLILVVPDVNLERLQKLQRVHLKPNAVPKFFSSLAKYLYSSLSIMHVTSSTSSSSTIILQKQNSDFLIQDSLSDFSSFTSKMKNAVFPFGYTSVYSAPFVQFYFVKNDDNCKVAPELTVFKIILSKSKLLFFLT